MGQVTLKAGERFNHYSIVGFFAVIAASGLIIPLVMGRGQDPFQLGIAVIASVLGWLAYVMQRRALQFTRFATQNSVAENYAIVVALAAAKGWSIVHYRSGCLLVMAVPGFPKSMLSWGERVTVKLQDTTVAVNSICNPALHPSVVSYGRNGRNVRAVAEAVSGVRQ